MRKYFNVPCEWNGRKYPSKKQRDRAKVLRSLEKDGLITNLQEEVNFKLVVNGLLVGSVRLDFVYCHNGSIIYEDVKGFFPAVQRVKYKLFESIYGQKILLT